MYSKEEVINRIGESNWELFEIFSCGKQVIYDEYGFETYYPADVVEFCKLYNID